MCVDHIRKRGGQQTVALSDTFPDADVRERSDRLDRVLELIRSLPPKDRELLRLRLAENLSYEEISRRTGLNKIGLRVAFHRLKNQLKKKI
jgi:RNA polymerase sigma factor (sigma-70 family)